jgi:DNA-directed RNA polymerase subunit N (RpoN/RPB10)
MVIYTLMGANRGKWLRLITNKIIRYKGDTLDYNDVSELAKKIENPREYLKYPRFTMGLRKIGGMGEAHISSLMGGASNSQELGEIFIELDAKDSFLDEKELNYIMMSVNQPEEIFKKLGSKRQAWWRTFITKNDIYDIMTYSRKPLNVLKTLPKETVQQGIDSLSKAELDKALKFGRDTELIVNLKHLGFDLKEYND